MSMYVHMKKLIESKFYKTEAEALKKLDVFYAMNRLTDEEYIELCQLANTVYNPPVVEPPTEPNPVADEPVKKSRKKAE